MALNRIPYFAHSTANDLVMAKLSTWPDFVDLGYSLDTMDVIDAVAAALAA